MRTDDCYRGNHDQCDGTNLDSMMGCSCSCHDEEAHLRQIRAINEERGKTIVKRNQDAARKEKGGG